MNAVTIKNLLFFYGNEKTPVLDDLSLTVPKGKVTGILGPNGAGKTTLLSLILGLLKPESGEVFICDKAHKEYGLKKIRQMIGLVSQNESVPFDLTIREYVLLGRAPYLHVLGLPGKNDMAVAMDAIRKTGIEHMISRTVPSLSSGEKQLASIARALAQTPEILLFDEPTSHLDLTNSRRILRLMETIAKEENRTVIFTTHDPNAAAAIADHIILMGKERLTASGSPAEVFTEKYLSEAYGDSIEVLDTQRGPVILAI